LINIPFPVSQFLFNGISNEIEFVANNIIPAKEFGLAEEKIRSIYEAINYYKENAVISASHLEMKFEDLKNKYASFVTETKGSN